MRTSSGVSQMFGGSSERQTKTAKTFFQDEDDPIVGGKVSSPTDDLEARGFNPQPEPPARPMDSVLDDLESVGFNPQPEPPAKPMDSAIDDLEAVGFNPQPEPPAIGGIDAGFDLLF